jgi:hypothetical protein
VSYAPNEQTGQVQRQSRYHDLHRLRHSPPSYVRLLPDRAVVRITDQKFRRKKAEGDDHRCDESEQIAAEAETVGLPSWKAIPPSMMFAP